MMKYILTGVFLIAAFTANAQEQLSLSEAIQQGLENNFAIRIESKNLEVAENNNNWGEAGRYPTVSLNLNQNNSLTDNIKTASPFQLQDQTVSNSLNPTVNLNWTLFNGFKINISKSRLADLQAESDGNADIVISNAIQSIILGYYKTVLEKRRLDEFQRQLTLSRDKYEYTTIKSELGSAVSTELLLEEGNYLTDSTNFINQQLVYRNAMRDLKVLLGKDDMQINYVLTDGLNYEDENYQLEELLSKLNSKNVDLKKQYISQQIMKHNLGLAKADRYPTVSLNSGYSHNRSRVDLSNASFPSQDGSSSPGPTEPLNAVTDNYFANFTISFTLFNGGKINRAIQNAIIQEDIANLQTAQLKTNLYRDLAKAFDQYQIRKQLYGITERKQDAANTNLSISEEKFKNGSINSFDYRTVQNNSLSASLERLQAIYNLIDSKISLMRLTGGIIETYVE
ncbi:MAG: TolC family protein [Fulvivirga sp.]